MLNNNCNHINIISDFKYLIFLTKNKIYLTDPVTGGSMDWVRKTLGTPLVYTYELRGDDFHWPPERIPEQGKELTQMLLGLILEAENMDYFKKGTLILENNSYGQIK